MEHFGHLHYTHQYRRNRGCTWCTPVVPYHEIDSTDAMETAVNFLEKGIENKMYVRAD